MNNTEKEIHVIPINDVYKHKNSIDCWCHPERDDEEQAVIIHNSRDGRELCAH